MASSVPGGWIPHSPLPVTQIGSGDHVINLKAGSHSSFAVAASPQDNLTLNMATGNVWADVKPGLVTGGNAEVTINLSRGTNWFGTLSVGTHYEHADYTINAARGAVWWNYGDSDLFYTSLLVPVPVKGQGTFETGMKLEFMKGVGFGEHIQTLEGVARDIGVVQIDDPREFLGSVDINTHGAVDLEGLAKVDSYTFKNDMLTLYQGDRAVESLRLMGALAGVEKTPTGVFAFANDGGHINMPAIATPLPVHA